MLLLWLCFGLVPWKIKSSVKMPCFAKVVESLLGSSLLYVTEQPLTVP